MKKQEKTQEYIFKYVFSPNSNIDINEVIKSSFINAINQEKY